MTTDEIANLKARIERLENANALLDEALTKQWRLLRLWQGITTRAAEDHPGEIVGLADVQREVNQFAQSFYEAWCATKAAKDAQRALT